jgi:ferredoxin
MHPGAIKNIQLIRRKFWEKSAGSFRSPNMVPRIIRTGMRSMAGHQHLTKLRMAWSTQTRVMFGTQQFHEDEKLVAFLSARGYVEADLQAGMLRIFSPSERTIAFLESLGESALKALAESVERELLETRRRAHLRDVHIRVVLPMREGGGILNLVSKVGVTFFDLVKEPGTQELLSPYMECACGGLAACSTCHVLISDEESFARLPAPEEAELDMLDLTEGVTSLSRLGCQLTIQPKPRPDAEEEGASTEGPDLVVHLPESVTSLW